MAIPAPTAPPAAAAARAATVELMIAVLEAFTERSCFASTFVLLAISAFVSVRMTFVALAPAPATATPTSPPPIATEAADVVAVIVAASFASTVMLPTVDCSIVAMSRIEAVMLLSISL